MTSPATTSLRDQSRSLPVLTLVTWTLCVAVGVTGLALRYGQPTVPAKTPLPVIAQTLVVELTDDPVPPVSQAAPKPPSFQPPPLAPQITLPSAPPTIAVAAPSPIAVAAPSPNIAFAVPIQAPAHIVEAAQASYRTVLTQHVETAPVTAAAPQPLTYGVGEGKQPAPEYPRLAMRQGQEGVVVVRMSVAADGRVAAADAATPSPWPLLNDAALRVVRQRWRFSAGTPRTYEVAIRFQLNRTNS
jgi:periplasmic protein TonB